MTALESAMYAPGAVWTLLRADPGAAPPGRPIAWARRPVAYLDHGADHAGSTRAARLDRRRRPAPAADHDPPGPGGFPPPRPDCGALAAPN